MPEKSKTRSPRLSVPEFLEALERSAVIPDGKLRAIRDRFVQRPGLESSMLARQLVEEGTLTDFQARRLLAGKKSLSFGRYALLDQIGQGARGRVYKASHRLMDRVVAIKVLLPGGEISMTSVARFFREMKIVGLLDHPNVVRAIDADLHERSPYIVMEYLEGSDLEEVCARRGQLPVDEVLDYMVQAARGVAHAHAQGVIHRDIKPTNLFLVNSGVVKVLDLGFGELIGMAGQAGNVFDTDEGVVVGTTDFMSPEQVKDRPIDARTDLFSMGCTMYRLLAGGYAFPGVTREDRLIKRIREPHVPITDVRQGLPDRLVAIVDRLLAMRPEDRFSSAAEVADALEALIPPSSQTQNGMTAKSRAKRALASNVDVPAEPEALLDWSMVESALRPPGDRPGETPRLADRDEKQIPSKRSLSSHRKTIEADGDESGREVLQQYRNELKQMKSVMAELRSTDPKDEVPGAVETWLERIGEKFGEFLAEPSATQIIAIIIVVLIGLAFAASYALGP